MKRLVLLFTLATLISSAGTAQEKGMKFEHGTTWAKLKAKAKAERKYIFMDAFTTWCGPCKVMAADIFPLAEVGDFYNANYINVKVQLDTTTTDNEEVKAWYKDAHDIMAQYKVNAFPTYLFFNTDGELVHRELGSSPANVFITKGKNALDPEKQYYTMKRKYDGGERDPAFLLKLARAAQAAYDNVFGPEVSKQYLATQTNLYTAENINLLYSSTTKVTDPGFKIFRYEAARADSFLRPGLSDALVKRIATQSVIYPAIYPNNERKEQADWSAAELKLKEHFAGKEEELLLPIKASHYQRFNNWPKFTEIVSAYVSKFGGKVTAMELNSFAWAVFENCDDATCVQTALNWSKSSLTGKDEKNAMFMDTYANLLYKTGKKEDAIRIQEEAIKITGNKEQSLVDNLEKMKKGEKTWN